MKTYFLTIYILLFSLFLSCNNLNEKDKAVVKQNIKIVYAKEPNDSADYKLLKNNFYLHKNGQLCERKLAFARDKSCNCNFEVYYDSTLTIYLNDSTFERPLNTILDIKSFTCFNSSEYSKDKNRVYYFYGNSDGGNRVIVHKADPLSFKSLCEYRWGIDKNYVFYKGDIIKGVNIKQIQVLYSPDTTDHFINYIKDDKNVFYTTEIVKGADAKTFKVVSGQKWDAEDKNYKYENGGRIK